MHCSKQIKPECRRPSVLWSTELEGERVYKCEACGLTFTTIEVPEEELRRLVSASLELRRLKACEV